MRSKIRIKSSWFKGDRQKTPQEVAGALAYTIWRISDNTLKNVRKADFDIAIGEQYFETLEPEATAEGAKVRSRKAGAIAKRADTLLGWSSVRTQVGVVPLQAPVQPRKPKAGDAVSTSRPIGRNLAALVQSASQSIPTGSLTRVPPPLL